MNATDGKSFMVYSDGGARGNPGPAASAFVVFENNKILFSFKKYLGVKTNNWAEYYGIYLALLWISKQKSKYNIEKIIYHLDSELAVNQLTGKYKVKSNNLKNLFVKIKEIEKEIALPISFKHIPREQNKTADKLVNESLDEKR